MAKCTIFSNIFCAMLARRHFINEFDRQMYDRIGIMIPKGEKEIWKAEADRRNMSLAQFIQSAVAQYVENQTETSFLSNSSVQNKKEP